MLTFSLSLSLYFPRGKEGAGGCADRGGDVKERRWRSDARGPGLNVAPKVLVVVAVLGALAGTHVPVSRTVGRALGPVTRAPKTPEEIVRIIDEDLGKPRFDGSVLGWRLAPTDVLAREGRGGAHLTRDCEPAPAGADRSTQLDFTLSYFPPTVTIESVAGPLKWVCGGLGLSVMYDFDLMTPYGVGGLRVERAVWGERALTLHAANDRVEAASINGRPAVFAHPADDASGLGHAVIMVIEDDVPPEFTVLRVIGDEGIPFAELVKIAEGVR